MIVRTIHLVSADENVQRTVRKTSILMLGWKGLLNTSNSHLTVKKKNFKKIGFSL